ncbi:hypothetical protein J6590_031124 [Homalodisca vitripennis]|nr:hypothetical protein J6590_031124 [Homalodisca vitripennis]
MGAADSKHRARPNRHPSRIAAHSVPVLLALCKVADAVPPPLHGTPPPHNHLNLTHSYRRIS